MSTVATYGSGALSIVRRDLAVFISYRLRAVSILFTSVFGLILFHYVSQLVNVSQFPQPEDYFAFVVVGMVSLGVLTATLSSGPTLIRQELVAGTFERILVSPFGAVAAIASMSIFPLLMGLMTGIVTLAVAGLAFDLPVTWDTAPLAIPVALLGGLSFAPFGLLVCAAMIVMKQAQALGALILTGVSIVAGLYFPVSLLPDWIRWTSDVQPFTPAVDLLRHLLVGAPVDGSPWTLVAKLAAFTIVLMPLAFAALAGAIELGRRRGTIAEY